MGCDYICEKKTFDLKHVQNAQVFFGNGDYFTLRQREIADINITFYDELRIGDQGFFPVASKGFIKCKISGGKKSCLLYHNESIKNLKEYLEKRCVNEGGIRYIRLCDEKNWSLPFYCFVDARMENGFLVLNFKEGFGYGTDTKEYHTVKIRDITKESVEKIDLDFENCEGFEIFQDEIQDIRLSFENELEWSSDCFSRKVSGGFIRLKFDKDITWRKTSLNSDQRNCNIKALEKRLVDGDESKIDICHLYVTYDYAGFGLQQTECVCVRDIRLPENQDMDYVSGYARREKDGCVLIVFGE